MVAISTIGPASTARTHRSYPPCSRLVQIEQAQRLLGWERGDKHGGAAGAGSGAGSGAVICYYSYSAVCAVRTAPVDAAREEDDRPIIEASAHDDDDGDGDDDDDDARGRKRERERKKKAAATVFVGQAFPLPVALNRVCALCRVLRLALSRIALLFDHGAITQAPLPSAPLKFLG